MSVGSPPIAAACPACVAMPETKPVKENAVGDIILSLPTIHCAGCISAVERELAREPRIRDARVNLSLKRVSIHTNGEFSAQDAIKRLADIGYQAHELDPSLLSRGLDERTNRGLLMRLAVAGFAAMNVMLLSVAVWSGAEAATRDMMHWISALIALPAIAFAAQPFFQNAWRAISVGRLNMDVPISLAILLAAAMSLYETTQSGAHAYFDAALSLTFFLLAGRYLDHRTRSVARSAAQELAALEVPRALRLVNGSEVLTPLGQLRIGDRILVKPGTRMPVDGKISTGESEVDRAFLTGESLPGYAGPGMTVSAGEINLTGPLEVEVTALSADSSLQKVTELVALAETSKNTYTSIADRAASIYAPGVHLLAAFAFLFWFWFAGDLRLALNIAVSVLIITCPCALGLAVPAVTTAASGRLFARGVLLKSATALERLAEIDTVVFDKTGTLTKGEPRLVKPQSFDPLLLNTAASLAQHTHHPLAKALAQEAPASLEVTDIKEIPGYGIEGMTDGKPVRLGRADWLGAKPPLETSTCLQIADGAPVVFTFTDQLRPGAETLIRDLKKSGLSVQLLTGDNEAAAADIGQQLGIETISANKLPDEKLSILSQLSAQGRKVLMVGDGLNDTAALAAAHVSISPSSAIDAARTASDIVLLGQDFEVISNCIKTAKSARARIKENFALAALYNLVAVPIALAGFATPLIAALAMSASSITVSVNAWRVR